MLNASKTQKLLYLIASAEETVVLSGTHLFNEGEVIWLHLFDINPDFAFAVKVIFAAQNIVPDGVNYDCVVRKKSRSHCVV